jgi:hypothetical protein
MKALTMATAAISAAIGAMPFDPRFRGRRRLFRMPHYGAKESAKWYVEVVNPRSGHSTIRRAHA